MAAAEATLPTPDAPPPGSGPGPEPISPDAGLLYNGSLVRFQPWHDKAGVYCIHSDCNDYVKIGMAAGNSQRGGLGVRMATFSTSFVEFRILMMLTFGQSKEKASIAENEAHTFVTQSIGESNVRRHVSGNRSEWFMEVPISVVDGLVRHMLDREARPLSTKHTSNKQKVQPDGAWLWTDPVEMSRSGLTPHKYDLWYHFASWDDESLRWAQKQRKQALEDGDAEKVQENQEYLDTFDRGARVELTNLTDLSQFDSLPMVRSTEATTADDPPPPPLPSGPSGPRYNTRYQVRKASLGERAAYETF